MFSCFHSGQQWKYRVFRKSIVSCTERLGEKGLFLHGACVRLGADSTQCTKGIMKSVIKFWGLKVDNVLLYVPKSFRHDLFIQDSSAHYFLEMWSDRKRRTNSNFEILCGKIYIALHLQIFFLTSIFHMYHFSFLFFRK